MPNNYAVLVGINRYDGFIRHNGKQVPLSHYRLYGCVNDANSMSELLICDFGFSKRKVKLLTDGDATQSAILESLTGMVESAKPDDKLLFYFSGHGSLYSRTPSPAGVPSDRRVQEILCPCDVDWDQERFISDDDLKAIVSKLANGTTLEIVLDTCCAGAMKNIAHLLSMTKQADADRVGGPRFLRPPDDVLARIDMLGATIAPRLLSALGSVDSHRCVLWAASQGNQTSEEYVPSHGREHGAFTYFFYKALGKDPTALRRVVIEEVAGGLHRERFSQIPGLYPDVDEIVKNGFLISGIQSPLNSDP